ncbi:MAG: glycosyltransferase [Kaistella sp.]
MKISVALCTYNGERHISEQLNSILSQSLSVTEIVICDDRSSDNTTAIIAEMGRENSELVKMHINSERLGSIKNFEQAIRLCEGDFIFLSDQDDVWDFQKVQTIISAFKNFPDINVIASNGNCLDGAEIIKNKISVWDIVAEIKKHNKVPNYFEIISVITNIATGATMALRRDFLKDLFDLPVIKDFHHDEWICLIAARNNQFLFMDEKLINYRIHENQQVGIHFFDLKNTSLDYLLKPYKFNKTFDDYRHLLKLVSKRHNRNLTFAKNLHDYKDAQKLLLDSVEVSRDFFIRVRYEFKKEFPVKFFVLGIFDSITNKRKIG